MVRQLPHVKFRHWPTRPPVSPPPPLLAVVAEAKASDRQAPTTWQTLSPHLGVNPARFWLILYAMVRLANTMGTARGAGSGWHGAVAGGAWAGAHARVGMTAGNSIPTPLPPSRPWGTYARVGMAACKNGVQEEEEEEGDLA